MEIYSYENYEEYLDEVYPEPPKTLEAHQKRLAEAIEISSSPAHWETMKVMIFGR